MEYQESRISINPRNLCFPTTAIRKVQFQYLHEQLRFDAPIPFNKILVIGLGQLGLPVAKYVKDRGFDVYGYDISTKAIERAEKTAGIKKAVITLADLMFILYVFQHINKKICFHLK